MTIKAPSTPGEQPIVEEIEDLQHEMERLAGDEQWPELAAAMEYRDNLLSKVTGVDRSQIFSAALHSNHRVLEFVRKGRRGAAEQLTSLRRGREATGQYDSHRASA